MDMMMMEDEEVVQMVDDDEVENVGIMSGFMEDIEELMEEISEAEMNGVEEGDDADMARMMNRTPDSPEILMNNLRGDMRSIDARREELADLVGMRQAEETPEGVLALLQPVLAQQDAMAAMPMPMPAPQMPPPPMPPMPAQPAGIESITVDETVVPAMYRGGSVQNFNRGSGQMGVTPAQSMSPSGVRYYANGTPEEGVVSSGRFSPAAVASADQYIKTLLEAQPSAPTTTDLPTMMGQEAALYETLGLGTPKEATQAQMLFDIGQAALQFGSNVGADGQPMRGSAAARLAQVAGPLAGRIGARAGEMSKEARALKMLALQSAQNKIATAQAADTALAERQGDLAVEIAKQPPAARMLTEADFQLPQYAGLDRSFPWQIDSTGKLSIAGGRADPPLFQDPYEKKGREQKFEDDKAIFTSAKSAVENIAKLDEALTIIEEGDINVGIGSEIFTNFNRLKAQFLNDPEAASITAQNQYLDSLLGSDVFTAIGALGIGARGLDTPAERDFLIQVMTGSRTMDREALAALTTFRKIREVKMMKRYNEAVDSGRLAEYGKLGYTVERLEVPEMPVVKLTTVEEVRSIEEAQQQQAIDDAAAARAAARGGVN